ncbi:hypothetical protein CEQ90_06275 [Lewinellaceae bacterium SD302]|nr:hypothetical protein CEQ90_06275 [Lewinellaceae bacterium SD302]
MKQRVENLSLNTLNHKSYTLLPLLFACLLLSWLLPAQVTFLPAGGLYGEEGVRVEIQVQDEVSLFYTLDGSAPDRQSLTYRTGDRLHFYQTTVLRVAAYSTDGEELFQTGTSYLVDEPTSELPTISVGIDSRRLFDPVHGWFVAGPRADKSHWKMPGANFWTHKEFAGHLDMYEPNGSPIFHGRVGYRLFGGMSRLHPQKSLSVSWRKRYGADRLHYPVFGEEELDSFKYLVFRNGGSDWSRSHIRDVVMSDLLRNNSWEMDHQANRPARLYINGEYWGLYHIREKINRTFVADHNGYHRDSLDLLEHESTVKAGTDRRWLEMLRLLRQHRYIDSQKMQQIGELMDVDNFMRLQIAQTYFDNRDAGGNIRYYRPWQPDRNGRQRWRWILYDLDYGFGLHDPEAYAANTLALLTEPNGPAWPNPPWSTLLQRRLLTNPEYRANFVNRSLDYLQTDFTTEAVQTSILAHANAIEKEMPRALARWNLKESYWRLHLDRLLEFAEKRPAHLREHLREFALAGEDRELNIYQNEGGKVMLNSNVHLQQAHWRGWYFSGLPVELRALADPGFHFVGWEGEDGRRSRIIVDLTEDKTYRYIARFEKVEHDMAGAVIINEIATSSTSGGAWVELRNLSNERIDLRDWLLYWGEEDGESLRLPNVSIEAGEQLVLVGDQKRFAGEFILANKVAVLVGQLNVLKRLPGEMGLYGPRGSTVDVARFPEHGNRLELAAAHLDNADPENWWAGEENRASPGESNAVNTMAFHWRYNNLWQRLAIALCIIGVGYYWLRRRSADHPLDE